MAPRYDGDGAQPGLEVVPQERNQAWPEARDTANSDGKELFTVSKYPGSPAYSDAPEPQGPPLRPPVPSDELAAESGGGRKRRRLIVVGGGLIALIVIVGAVLGGVLGSRAANSSTASPQEEGAAANQNPTANPTGTATAPAPSGTQLQQIRRGSALTATGIRKTDGGLDMFLFYQDPKDEIRFSRCDTAPVLNGSSQSCWDVPMSINTFARADTQLSVSTILYGAQFNGQTQLVYAGEKNRFLSSNLNDRSSPRVVDDSVNARQIVMGANSTLSSYWPWTLYQDATGRVHHVRNRLFAGYSPAAEWDDNMLDVTALNGSSLAIVPMSTNMSRIAEKGGYGFFYQNSDGRLAVSITDLSSPELDSTYPLSWPTTIPSITLPRRAPIAAVSVARPSDARQRVDTYVLYLDAASNINVLYTDTSSGSPVWRTSQPGALRGVDAETRLTCLNMATSQSNALGSPQLLEQASSDTKCYFQRGGLVMEARLDRADWVVTGNVPIP